MSLELRINPGEWGGSEGGEVGEIVSTGGIRWGTKDVVVGKNRCHWGTEIEQFGV